MIERYYLARHILLLLMVIAAVSCGKDNSEPAVKSPSVSPESGPMEMATAQSAETAPAPPVAVAAPGPEPESLTPAPQAPAAESAPSPEPSAAQAQQHVVKGVVTQWAPMVLFINPGDQVVFKQMVGHDAETIDGMIPDGAETWKSKLGQEGFAVTLDVPGAYVYKCNPHVSLGMIGVIVVGETPPSNLAAIEAHPQNKGMIGRAIRKLKKALENPGSG